MKLSFRKSIFIVIMISIVLLLILQTYYINRINRTTNEQIASYMDMTITQIENNLNNMIKNLTYSATNLSANAITGKYLTTADPMERYSLRGDLNDSFRTMIALDRTIMNILLIDNEGNIAYSYGNTGYISQEEAIEVIEETDVENTHFTYAQKAGMQGYLICMSNIYSDTPIIPIDSRKIGTLVMVINIQSTIKSLEKIDKKGEVDLFLLGSDDLVIAANSSVDPFTNRSGYTNIERSLSDSNFRIVCQINQRKVAEQYKFYSSSSLFICIIMASMLLIIGIIFNRIIATPIQCLMQELEEVGINRRKKRIDGNFGVQLDPLVININQMLYNIDTLTHTIFDTQQKMYEQELMRHESDLYALRNQINPHFIFNTLQCMSGIALMHGERKVAEISASMSELFYYALKDGNMVRLQEEYNLLEKYFKITSERFLDKFVASIEIPVSIQRYNIMKMLLQPIVENAVCHGMETRICPNGGKIMVIASEEEEFLVFEIKDNGYISDSTIEELNSLFNEPEQLRVQSRSSKKIGLANIQYRIKLFYGIESGIYICKQDEWTVLKMKLRKIPSSYPTD